MTIRDFTHFAEYGEYVYIYKTPDSADYTLLLLGSRRAEEMSADGDRPKIDSDVAWGIVYRCLQHIAEANDSPQESTRYELKADKLKRDTLLRSHSKKTGHLDRIQPYNLR